MLPDDVLLQFFLAVFFIIDQFLSASVLESYAFPMPQKLKSLSCYGDVIVDIAEVDMKKLQDLKICYIQ